MMSGSRMIFTLVSIAVVLVGAVNTTCQIYKMTKIDAQSRGLKHPRFWGLFAMNGNNSSELLLYLIGRKNYPVINMSEAGRREIASRKRRTGAGLIFLAVGAIGMIISLTIL